MLVALKCDLREKHADDDDETTENDVAGAKKEKGMIDYKQGLEVARRIQALRYLGTFERPFAPIFIWLAEKTYRMFGETKPRRQ